MQKDNSHIRVLLISPNVIAIKGGINRLQPGLGIMYIASCLEEHGYNVKIRDTAIEGYQTSQDYDKTRNLVLLGETDEEIRTAIEDFRPHVVGISVLFYNQAPQAHHVARIAKDLDPNTLVVVGGNHVAAKYRSLMEDRAFDFVMVKECEYAFRDLLDAYFNKLSCEKVPGLVWRKDGELKVNKGETRLTDLDLIPYPARHLTNMEQYFEMGMFHNPYSKHDRIGNVMTSRGCPEKCTFCTTPMIFGNTMRYRSPQNVFGEIRQLVSDYKVGEIQFEDDTLTLNYNNLMELCDLIEPLNLHWNTVNGIRADYHGKGENRQRRMFQRMRDSGCYQVCLGVESGNQILLDTLVKKRLDLAVVPKTVANARLAGLSVHIFVLLGLPGETMEDMQMSVDYMKSLGADSYSVSIFSPLPGTPLFNYAKEKQLLVPDFSEDRILFAKSNIVVEGVSTTEFEDQISIWNNELNSKLKETNPVLYKEKYGRFIDGDEDFHFRKHS